VLHPSATDLADWLDEMVPEALPSRYCRLLPTTHMIVRFNLELGRRTRIAGIFKTKSRSCVRPAPSCPMSGTMGGPVSFTSINNPPPNDT